MQIDQNSVVSIHYTLTNDEGTVIDSSINIDPLVYLQGAGNTVLLSMHGDVRAELAKNKIPYALVYPDIALRDEYRDRYRMRGDTEDFVHTLLAYWAPWITSCADDYNAAKLVELRSGEYLSYKLNTLGVLA